MKPETTVSGDLDDVEAEANLQIKLASRPPRTSKLFPPLELSEQVHLWGIRSGQRGLVSIFSFGTLSFRLWLD